MSVDLLICFAVKEESRFFHAKPGCQVCLTGMGQKNAAESIRKALALMKPKRVITAGFAGGLNPALKRGDVICQQNDDTAFEPQLKRSGAQPAQFHCHSRVVVTAAEKAGLWQKTGADAVEMESSVIRAICQEFKIPSATIRVISDDATQDLPLDFNALMTSGDRIDYPKLLWSVVSHPSHIPRLIEFQRQTTFAARKLGAVLDILQEQS